MQSKFYKITSLEKKKNFIRVFSKQHDFTSQDSLVVGSNSWGFCGVAGTPLASRGGRVSSWYQSIVLGNLIKHRSFLIHYFTLLATMHFQIQSTYILSVSKYETVEFCKYSTMPGRGRRGRPRRAILEAFERPAVPEGVEHAVGSSTASMNQPPAVG